MIKNMVSVIVPVYNGVSWIEGCLESILAQTYQELEVLVLDDNSTDGTTRVVKELAEKDARVRLILRRGKGVSGARNQGLEEAKGEYVTFVDADDRILPDMLQRLHETMKRTKCDIAGCRFFTWEDETKWQAAVQDASCTGEEKHYSPEQFLEDELLQGNSRCWSKLYHHSVLENAAFRKELSIGEDMVFLLELLQHVESIVEIPYQGYGYFQNPQGAMNRKFLPRYMDQITCWEIARDLIEKHWKQEPLTERATAILMMAIMLTVGKIAVLSQKERKEQAQYVHICRKKLRQELPNRSAYNRLSAGYQVKVALFSCLPKMYLWLYHLKKYKQ